MDIFSEYGLMCAAFGYTPKIEHKTSFKSIFEHNYYISTADTPDCGYETMIFFCDGDGVVHDWGEIYCEHHISGIIAVNRHDEILKMSDDLFLDMLDAWKEK